MKNAQLLVGITIILLFQFFVSSFILNVDELIFNLYSDQLAKEQFEELLNKKKEWEWVSYVIIPLMVLIRSSLVAICISVGMFFYQIENTYKYKQFFKIALLGEFVLVLVGFFKLGYFYFIKTEYTLQDLQQYYPLSYTNLINLENVEPWLLYPLQTINLFEVAYFFVLAYGLYKLTKRKYTQSLEIVTVSYGSGLIIWLGVVTFFTLNMS